MAALQKQHGQILEPLCRGRWVVSLLEIHILFGQCSHYLPGRGFRLRLCRGLVRPLFPGYVDELFHQCVAERARQCRPADDARQGRVRFFCNARYQRAAQAVAYHKQPLLVHLRQQGCLAQCLHCIVHHLRVVRQLPARHFRRPRPVHLGALVVTYHCDALSRQRVCQFAERLVRSQRLVAVLRSAALHQHYRRHWFREVFGQGQRARQFNPAVLHREILLREILLRARPGRRGGLCGCGRCRCEGQSRQQ